MEIKIINDEIILIEEKTSYTIISNNGQFIIKNIYEFLKTKKEIKDWNKNISFSPEVGAELKNGLEFFINQLYAKFIENN